MNMRGNNPRKKAPAAFWDKVLNTACATTAEKKTIKPMIAGGEITTVEIIYDYPNNSCEGRSAEQALVALKPIVAELRLDILIIFVNDCLGGCNPAVGMCLKPIF